jgi:hypothetical protein
MTVGRGVLTCVMLAGIGLTRTAWADPYADLVQARLAAIKELVIQSKEVCDSIPMGGYRNETELQAAANVKLNGVLSKIADIGASGAIKDHREQWENVAQDKLADVLKDKGNCKANFVVTMSNSVLAPPPAPK